jgi:hypothetical protein
MFHYVPVAKLTHRSGGADGHRMPYSASPDHPLTSTKLKFNPPNIPQRTDDDDKNNRKCTCYYTQPLSAKHRYKIQNTYVISSIFVILSEIPPFC